MLALLEKAAPHSQRSMLRLQRADLEDYTFNEPADLVVAFSALEHLSGLAAIRDLLDRIQAALRPGGVVAVGMVADRHEVDDDGRAHPALIESELSAGQAETLLDDAFGTHHRVARSSTPARVREHRGGRHYQLCSTLVTAVYVSPG